MGDPDDQTSQGPACGDTEGGPLSRALRQCRVLPIIFGGGFGGRGVRFRGEPPPPHWWCCRSVLRAHQGVAESVPPEAAPMDCIQASAGVLVLSQ